MELMILNNISSLTARYYIFLAAGERLYYVHVLNK